MPKFHLLNCSVTRLPFVHFPMVAPVIRWSRRISNQCLFFFHAEAGIRDRDVTGVQTCALPIFPVIGDQHYERVIEPACVDEFLEHGAQGVVHACQGCQVEVSDMLTQSSTPMRKRKRTFWPANDLRSSWEAVYPQLSPTKAGRPNSGLVNSLLINPP